MTLSNDFTKNFNFLSYSRLLQELIFYYPIFVPFVYSLGLGVTELAYYVIAVNIGVLLFEVPSGVLADRWSRKGTLFLATFIHMASIITMGTSNSASQVIFGAFLWGIFFAMQSGTHHALIYDMLKTEKATASYKKYVAKFSLLGTLGLVIGSIAGAAIARYVSLPAAYFLTLIPSFLSLFLLAKVVEPKQHQLLQTFSALKHYGVTFSYLRKKGLIGAIVLALILIEASIGFLFELNQTYYVVASVPLILFGVYNASLQASIGLGFWLADKRQDTKSIIFALFAAVLFSVLLIIVVNPITAIGLSLIMMVMFYQSATLTHTLQDSLASEVRSAAISMISSAGRIVFIVLAIVFTLISNNGDIPTGFIVLTGITIIITAFSFSIIKRQRSSQPK